MPTNQIADLLGPDADKLLNYKATGFSKEKLHLPGPDFVDRVLSVSDRHPNVLRNFSSILNHGRLAGTGYVSILPVDQGIEHSAGASFAKNPIYFDGENIVKLAIEGGCNAVASTLGVLGSVCRKYAHKIPFLCKLNHNEFLSYPNKYDQIMFAQVKQAFDMGAVAVGATIYFGSDESDRQIDEVSRAFRRAHELGLVTVLWCYLRNTAFKTDAGRLSPRRRSDRPGESPRRHDRGRHHQAKTPRNQRRLHRPEIRQDRQARLLRTHPRQSSHRTDPLSGRQLLSRPQPADQLRRRIRRQRFRRRRPNRRHQQARRRHGPDQRPQGVPTPDGRRHQTVESHSGYLSR